MVKHYGRMWVEAGQRRGGNRGAAAEVKAFCKILWWALKNDWFEYPLGSRLLYFRFPYQYQTQALSGSRRTTSRRDHERVARNRRWGWMRKKSSRRRL